MKKLYECYFHTELIILKLDDQHCKGQILSDSSTLGGLAASEDRKAT